MAALETQVGRSLHTGSPEAAATPSLQVTRTRKDAGLGKGPEEAEEWDPTAPGIREVGKPTGGRGAKLRSRVEIWKLRRGWMQGQEVGR